MSVTIDRLYNLLPVVYRQRDAEQGYPLQQLLRVIAEQVNIVENDIGQLYDNWFIETCDGWVVPYIGELIGYRPVHQAGEDANSPSSQISKVLVPRREVANTIDYRRRKGTLWLLEQLAQAVTGWPARVVECGRHVAVTQSIDHLHLKRGQTTNLRATEALDLLEGPFDSSSRTLDVRNVNSPYSSGLHNLSEVVVFLWRLPVYTVTRSEAYCLEETGDHCFTFSILGNDTPLYNLPTIDPEPTDIAGELNLPTPIRRREFAQEVQREGVEHSQASEKYYGEGKSLAIWAGKWAGSDPTKPIPVERIIAANLAGWKYRPRNGYVGVDPELGRIVFPPSQLPDEGVWVSYHYAFSANIGGGEYERPAIMSPNSAIYCVGHTAEFSSIRAAYEQWLKEKPSSGVIEINDSGVYEEQVHIEVGENQSLEVRAANGARPVIYLVDWKASRPDALVISGRENSTFVLDGVLITGRGIEVRGKLEQLTIRHSTLVPGWALLSDCKPRHPVEPSLALVDTNARVQIEHSILGPIRVTREDLFSEPITVRISDSIVDASHPASPAISATGDAVAPVGLNLARCTVFGKVNAHSIELAQNSIFTGQVFLARRQHGCIRYCYVPPGSRTPRRYHCQPDLVDQVVADQAKADQLSGTEAAAFGEAERLRVAPQFEALRYGQPAYARLARSCAPEIQQGADDRSEMGVFHDLYEPQRAINLRLRLAEYTPAGIDVGFTYAS
jgi:hypothetical protein